MAVFDIDMTLLDNEQRYKDAKRAGIIDKDSKPKRKTRFETPGKAFKRAQEFLFDSSRLDKDRVIPGAVDFVNSLVEQGYIIAYCTARRLTFYEVTKRQLEKKGFPLMMDDMGRELLFMKSGGSDTSAKYKQKVVTELNSSYDVRFFFDDMVENLQAVSQVGVPGLYPSIKAYTDLSTKSNPYRKVSEDDFFPGDTEVAPTYMTAQTIPITALQNPPVKPRRKKMKNGKYRKEPAKKYIDRFMGNSKMVSEFPDRGQRYAVSLRYVEKFYGKSGLDSVGARRNPEEYSENYMVPRDIHRLGKAADRLEDTYEDGQEVPEWWKSKLSVAAKDTDTLADALEYVDERGNPGRSSLPFRPTSDCFLTYKGKLVAKDMGHYIAFPGGGVDPGESPKAAAKREVMEEVGAVLKGDLKSMGDISWVWNPEWADSPKRKKRYQQFQGEQVYFFTGEVEKFVKPTSDEGDAWSGKKLMKFSDAIAYLQAKKANLKYPNQAKYIDYQIACLSQIQKAKGKMTGAQYRAGVKKMLEARANPQIQDTYSYPRDFVEEVALECPNCGARDIEREYQAIGNNFVLFVWCEECGDSAQFEAGEVPEGYYDREEDGFDAAVEADLHRQVEEWMKKRKNPMPLMGLSVQVSGYRNAAGAFVMKGKKFLILQRSKKETSKHGLWELPGGKVEKGETPRQAAVIEAKEEAGLDIKLKANLGPHHDDKKKKTYHAYIATPKKGQKVKLSEEHSDYKWVTPEEVMAMPKKMVSHHLLYFLKKEGKAIRSNPSSWDKDEFERELAFDEFKSDLERNIKAELEELGINTARPYSHLGDYYIGEIDDNPTSWGAYKRVDVYLDESMDEDVGEYTVEYDENMPGRTEIEFLAADSYAQKMFDEQNRSNPRSNPRKNPNQDKKIEKGKKLYKHMNGKEPEKITKQKIDMGDVWYQVGEGGCWQIGYMSGKETGSSTQKYTHTFNEETQDGNFPKLYATMPESGKPLLIIQGGTWKIKTDDKGVAWIYD